MRPLGRCGRRGEARSGGGEGWSWQGLVVGRAGRGKEWWWEGLVVARTGRGKGWSWEGLVVRKEWWREGVVAGRTTGRERVSGVRGSWAGGPTPGWPWVRDAGGCRGPGAGASVRPRSRRGRGWRGGVGRH